MKYHEAKPIETRVHAVFMVTFEDGEKWIMIWGKEATVVDVVDYIEVQHPERKKFRVGLLGVGTYRLHENYVPESEICYREDGREINQDYEICI